MEYKSIGLAFFGLFAALVWALDYFKLYHKAQLVLPVGNFESRGPWVKGFLFVIGLIAWLLISFALTNPRKPLKRLPGDIEVNDVFLIVDVSRSMLADDLRPNRLEVAKEKLRKFAALRPTDRIGLIIFSEKVFTLLPLTTDPTLIDQVLSEIRIGGFLGSGTNIGDALALGVARAQSSETKNKVIILLTDGVNNIGNIPPLKAAKSAKDFKIKVYTIGLGTMKSRLPIGKSVRGVQQYQSIPGGSIDLKTLQEISDITGGKSYMANSENSLQEILQEIQKLEKTKINNNNKVIYEELFYPYLAWGLLLLILTEMLRKFLLKEVI